MGDSYTIEICETLDGALTAHLPDGTVLVAADALGDACPETAARRAMEALATENLSVSAPMQEKIDR